MRSAWALFAGILGLAFQSAWGGELVSLTTPGGSVRGEVVRVTKAEVVLKTTAGKEQAVPVAFLKPKEVYFCRKQVLPADDAQAHLELGEYCLKNKLKDEGEQELAIAKRLDAKGVGAKADELLNSMKAPGTPAGTDVAAVRKGDGRPPEKPADKTAPKSGKPETPVEKGEKPSDGDVTVVTPGEGDGDTVEVKTRDGKTIRVPRQFVVNRENVPARSPDEMKKFLDGQLDLLKKHCSSNWGKEPPREWKMEETAHFYIFSNLKPEIHAYFKIQCEELYKLLVDVLDHKEGELLWNNKCPIYFPSNRDQFISFGTNIDHTPAAMSSGGYFTHRGRDVHIVVPLLARQRNEAEKEQVRRATSTLRHEGTHAFLQLVGKNVEITRWLHEGMAQFIEFWYDAADNPERHYVERRLFQLISRDQIMAWEESNDRPMGGADFDGYAFAWARLIYLYRQFQSDKRKLPTMIRLIKDGKSEKEAMEQAFGQKVEKLEEVYQLFIKQAAKNHFKGL
jgi:hypothetical protein